VTAGVTVAALAREPHLVPVPTPALSPASAAAVAEAAARIEADRHLVDGPVLMVASASVEAVRAFAATYAWHVASRRGGVPEAGLGSLGVQVALADPERGLLWQRRSETVDGSGGWSISAAGVAVPGTPLRDQALAEVAEELGLRPAGMDGLAPLALVVAAPQRVVQVVYRARLRPGAEPRPDPREVADVSWVTDPRDLPGPLEPVTGGWWESLIDLARVH
jgi:ADP-ribose pyrophosphatase YjhB (NUDIX family)